MGGAEGKQEMRPQGVHYVYHLLDGQTLLYVGMTKTPAKRAYEHCRSGKWPASFRMKIVRRFGSWEKAIKFEVGQIEDLQPPGNAFYSERATGNLRKQAMPIDQARKVWFSTRHKQLAGHEVVEMMPGWTVNMGNHHFGSRYSFFQTGKAYGYGQHPD